MESNADLSLEETKRLNEEAKKNARDMLDRLSPAQRELVEKAANQKIEEDQETIRKIIGITDVVTTIYEPQREFMEKNTAQQHHLCANPMVYVPDLPEFCKSCGYPIKKGWNFCSNCGKPVETL